MNIGAMGEVGGEVNLIADELSRAVELTLNPTVAHEARNQAYNACESFKENSPWCAQAGLLLASGNQYSAVVKHFGLQLMEHTVKYRWTQITQAEKIFIKENAMKLLYMGGWETGHLNDALARVVVEMIKREWPQQWGTLLAELSDACARGHRHTQIVLHVFLRLVEDVATLQTLEQNQRRKDIYQALTSNMEEIFAFFMRLIELHVQEFREHTAAGDYAAAASNGRVVQVVLLTLSGFVEWVSMSHVVMSEGRLLHILCVLLQDDAFQLAAADCLLQIVNRKGSTKERKPLMILFSADAISCVHRAALASMHAQDEQHYLFLKKLAQVVVGLCQQLSALWSVCAGVGGAGVAGAEGGEPAWLGLLLQALLALGAHPSLTLAQAAAAGWLQLLKHEQLARHPLLLAHLPQYLHHAAPKLIKVSYPARRARGLHDAAACACADYDSEHEFNTFFSRCRTDILDSLRHCMNCAPLVTWAYVEQWTRAALERAGAAGAGAGAEAEWEALAAALDVVLSRLLSCEPRPPAAQGLQLLQRCVAATPQDTALHSLLLSFISALFVFLSCASSQLAGPGVGAVAAELLPRVLDKVFAALTYTRPPSPSAAPGPTPAAPSPPAPLPRDVKNLRRHAASLLVKLACKYPLLLLPVFGRLHEATRAALARGALSPMEGVTVQEALLLVSNHFCNYEQQSALVAEVLADSRARWAELAPHLAGGPQLARLLGLHAPPDQPPPDEAQRARRALLHALALLLGVVRRARLPADPDRAARGGFGAGHTPAGNPLWRNPCAEHVLPLLQPALQLARALHELAAPDAARHPAHARALRPPPAEARVLLALPAEQGAAGEAGSAAPAQRVQQLVHTLHDDACHLAGAAAAALGRELYAAPGLAGALLATVLHALPQLPDHWLRRVVRHALKPLLLHCPPAHYQDVALPLLDHVAPFMLVHLSQRWEYVASLYESGKLEEEGAPGSESQEVLEDILVRHLTREYLEVLKCVLVDGGGLAVEAAAGIDDMEEDSCGAVGGGGGSGRTPEQVSELGALALGAEGGAAMTAGGGAALQTVLRALAWPDATGSLRAAALALPLVRAAAGGGRLGAADAAGALRLVLLALQAHGQHDANQAALLALAVAAYDALRPRHPAVAHVLRDIPGVDAHDLQRLDDKLAGQHAANAAGAGAGVGANKTAKIDKSKRELFKKITSKLIGRNVGQLFRKEVLIVNLPSMQVPGAAAGERARGALDAPGGAGLDRLFATNAPS